MRFRKLLATLLVPAVLAIAAFGIAPSPASAMPRCTDLERQYEQFEDLEAQWTVRWRETRSPADLEMAQLYEEKRGQTGQAIMLGGC